MEYFLSIGVIAGLSAIMALSFYLPFMTGQISLAQAGFMALGAYTAAVCTSKLGVPYPLALLAGGLVAAVVGFLVGLPALRIKGIYLLLLTLGFGEIIKVLFINFDYTGGAEGFTGIPYQENTSYYVFGFLIFLILFLSQLRRSRMGRAFEAVGHDENAAEAMGINLMQTKLQAFTLGAFIAGIGGGMFAHYEEYLDPLMFGVMHSVEFIVFTIFGGIQIFWGPIFGALFLSFMPEFLREIQEWRMEIYGALLIIMMIIRPQGVIGLDTINWIKRKFRKIIPGTPLPDENGA